MTMIHNVAMLCLPGYVEPQPVLGRADTGGVVASVLALSRRLGAAGCRVDVFTRAFDGTETVVEAAENVRIVRVPCGPGGFVRRRALWDHADEYAANALAFIGRDDLRYDLLHGHDGVDGRIAALLSRSLERPFVHTVRSCDDLDGDATSFMRDASACIVPNERTASLCAERAGIDASRIDVVPPGVDLDRFRPRLDGEEEIDVQTPERFVLTLGRIDDGKGHAELLRAFSQVRIVRPDVHLVIGGGSPEPDAHEAIVMDRLIDVLDELELHDRVIFTGHLPDEEIPVYYRKADAYVLASTSHPAGTTVLEAMACGTPVVASRGVGVTEDLCHESDLLLVDSPDETELSRAIVRALADDDLVDRLRRGGRDAARTRFAWDGVSTKTLAVYDRCL